jgi:hypothetical protein
MLRVLAGKRGFCLLFSYLFGVKNHDGSNQTPFFCKSSKLTPISLASYRALLADFQTIQLKHAVILAVNPDASLFVLNAFDNGLAVQHDCVSQQGCFGNGLRRAALILCVQ